MKPDYGIDAPRLLRALLIGGALLLLGALVLPDDVSARRPLGLVGLAILGLAAVRLYGSRLGKLRVRDQIVDSLRLSGRERVLDLGCGRGLLMIGVAKRLTSGRAIGVDLWRKQDLLHNDPTEVLYNARAERVDERVELHTEDMRKLPFEDGSFDVVVSSWALHCVPGALEQRKVLEEAVRVLRPGGMFLLVDVSTPGMAAEALAHLGMVDVTLSGPSFLFVQPSRRVTARKPLASSQR